MKAGKFLKYFILLVVAGNLALVAYVFLGGITPKPTPMPNPNGYDDFVKAGQILREYPNRDYETNQEKLKSFISNNEEAFKIARTGLNRECKVPDDYSPEYFEKFSPQGSAILELALGIYAEGKLAKSEGRTNDSVESYLECCSLGEKACRGGIIIAKYHDFACEGLGRQGLQTWADSLDESECRKVCQTLELINSKEEPVENILAQEKKYLREGFSLGQKLLALKDIFSNQKHTKTFIDKYHQKQLLRRQMMIAFAVRAYELENGKRPASVADLVPAYLKAIPQDPVTGTNMVLGP